MIITGSERLYDIGRLANDRTIGALFDLDSTPEDTTLRDDIILIGQKDSALAAFLLDFNILLFEKLNLLKITIDVDWTALSVDGHQKGAEKGYCPAEPGNRCFQSIKAIYDETETVLAEWTFTGNLNCAKDIIAMLKQLLERLAEAKIKIKLRMDAGFYDDAFLPSLESYPDNSYEMGAPQNDWLKDKIGTLPYKSYYQSERQYCSFAYNSGLNGPFRSYHVERFEKSVGSQTDLFDQDQYNYRVVISNHDHQPQIIFKSYYKRDRVEKHI